MTKIYTTRKFNSMTVGEGTEYYLSQFNLTMPKSIKVKCFRRQKTDRYGRVTQTGRSSATLIVSNSRRPAGLFTNSNRGEDRWILESLICVQRDIKERFGLEFHIHHLVAQSRGGSYNVNNLVLIPASVNRKIGDRYFSCDDITRSCDHQRQDPTGMGDDIPEWFVCLPAKLFIAYYGEVVHSAKKAA